MPGVRSSPSAEAARALLREIHLTRVEDLPALLARVAPGLGARAITLYLVDYPQRVLVRFPRTGDADEDELTVDGTLAGRAHRDGRVLRSRDPAGVIWVPLLDGTDRLGVARFEVHGEPPAEAGPEELEPAEAGDAVLVSTLLAKVLSRRGAYGDSVELTRRRMPMSLAAEVQWAALPPLTFAAAGVVVSAALEPCYDIGGDSFDYAVNGDVLHVLFVDAVGHGVAAARLSVFAADVYRNARRSGLSLADTAQSLDRWVAEQFPGQFATGVVLELNTRTGQLDYVVAGHPAPVLFRDQRPVGELEGPTRYPFGLGDLGPGTTASMALEAGDRLLLYSDGIVEARREGAEFGTERLLDFLGRQLSARLPAPETLRRLIHQVLEYQEDELADDATAMLVEWSADASGRLAV